MIAGWQVLDAATTIRKNLLRAGYRPIPATGKAVKIPGWQDIVATELVIDKWFHQYDDAFNTGILTRTTPAVDIDVYDPDAAEAIEALLWEMIGCRGMVRFGRAPKRAVLFRTETPFKKITTPIFIAPSGTENKAEVLCDGQQIVVFGTHPDTGKAYSWHGGQPGEIARADLPELTEAMAQEFIARAAAILRAQEGWIEKARKPNGGNGHHDGHHAGGNGDEFDAIYGGRERKYALAALAGCAAELAGVAPGSRNDKLNAVAFRLGTMSARGWIGRDEVIGRLIEAAIACRLVADDGEAGARATIESGLSSGERTPHPDLADEAKPHIAGDDGVRLEDFVAYLPEHKFYHRPTATMWVAVSINAKIAPLVIGGEKIRATDWLDANQCAGQMTWMPGAPLEIKDKVITEGGWIAHPGATCLNLYRGPTVVPGNAGGAGRWLDHVRKVYPTDAEHLLLWFAHRVQFPGVKINHCLFLGGSPGIGKDTMLAPVINAVGPWNVQEIAPKALLDRFNGYIKGEIVRVSEARDLGDINRYEFYEATKTLCAAPPEVLRCNEKHTKEFYVPNVCGLILTSNYRDGIYLPSDDRRHYVAWSDLFVTDFDAGYWSALWSWYRCEGGFEHVAAFLHKLDLSGFDPAAPPPKTPAFWAVVDASAAPEDAEFADALDRIGNPNAVTLQRIKVSATDDLRFWLDERKNRRVIPHRFERCGYLPVRNNRAKDGYFVVNGTRQTIYVKMSLSEKERHKAAAALGD